MEELNQILAQFVSSGWELISVPSAKWLEGNATKEELVAAVQQADAACGNCGCEMDPLYKRCLVLLEQA